ncbi:MAG: NTP transferase domain-containing protein [Duncaniella sp.]|nr:NTP transferase domain-containing protein [Duncaniella sp.]
MDRHIITHTSTLIDALGKLNSLSGGQMTLLVVDGDMRMCGTLTDGDIRRAILRGVSLESSVTDAMHRDFGALREGDESVDRLREMRQRGVHLVPVLDAGGRVSRIIDTAVTRSILPVTAILMAGGKGERLRPLTLTTPKPLLPLGDRPVIDHNIDALARVGVKDIKVTVNYLAEQLEEHFSTPVSGVQVRCVRETMPMGTIGAVALCDIESEGDTIVMNSDLLTTISFEDMYLHHKSEGADITIAAIPYNISVPYAILATEGSRVTALEEKPSYSYYANAGIYMISNRLLRTLPADCRTDATDLIDKALADGLKVTYFPINGTWIDIGSPADYAHARELMRHVDMSQR